MIKTVPILLYHSVSDEAAPAFAPWAVEPELFRAHLGYLHEEGYTSLTVSQLARVYRGHGHLPDRPVVITFDDGFADFYVNALPLLEHYACTATIYITTAYIGQTSRWLEAEGEGGRPMLNWAHIKELAERGVECGAHTRTHPQLDTLSLAEARAEIEGSKQVLEQRLGKPVMSFAYPHGYHSPAVKRLVEQAGFSSACAVKHAVSVRTDDPFALARVIVAADTDLDTFKALLSGRYLRVAPRCETWQVRGWRLTRRAASLLKKRPSHLLEPSRNESS